MVLSQCLIVNNKKLTTATYNGTQSMSHCQQKCLTTAIYNGTQSMFHCQQQKLTTATYNGTQSMSHCQQKKLTTAIYNGTQSMSHCQQKCLTKTCLSTKMCNYCNIQWYSINLIVMQKCVTTATYSQCLIVSPLIMSIVPVFNLKTEQLTN